MTPEVQTLAAEHNLSFPGDHTNLQVLDCACRAVVRRPANITGEISPCCGAMAQRNGTCLICTSCGDTTACG